MSKGRPPDHPPLEPQPEDIELARTMAQWALDEGHRASRQARKAFTSFLRWKKGGDRAARRAFKRQAAEAIKRSEQP